VSDPSRSRLLAPGLIVLVVFVLAPAALWTLGKGYLWQVANLVLIFSLLAAALHLVTGVAGLLNLGHAAFYGVGAYVAALLGADHGVGFAIGLPAGGIVAAALAFLVALPTMRLVSIYFAVATLAIGQMIYTVLLNWVSVTKGPNGVMLFSGIDLFGLAAKSPIAIYFVVAFVVALSIWAIHRLSHSYYGNALRSLREDDQCAEAMGVDTARLKIEVFTISAFFAGLAGGLWAYTTGYVSPTDFNFSTSILVLAMVVVGGLGSLPGAILGAALLILLPELLRGFGDVRNILVGMAMFFSILFLPKGLMGEASALDLIRRAFGMRWRATNREVGWR
jgi:branched-chain amino acid transport system permease protein